MQEQTFEELEKFMVRYRCWQQEIVTVEMNGLRQFMKSFSTKDNELQLLAQKSTPHYNIFEILKIRHYETKVHTPFLAHLLNPAGSHHQGRLFFDSFFSEVLQIGGDATGIAKIRVMQERRNDLGQIDIQIRYEDGGRNKAVVIENKIYHHDETDQLNRYYKYLKRQHIEDCNLKLVYLTPNGRMPSAQSLGEVPEDCLLILSYQDDIPKWLRGCLEGLEYNALYFTLNQYLKIITSL